MLRPQKILAAAVTIGSAVVLITGCTSSTPEENVSQACVASEAFAGALTSFQDTLTPESTMEQVRAAWDEVQNTYDDLIEASDDVAQDRVDSLTSATDELRSAVDNVPDDATMPQAVESLQNEADDVQTARGSLENELTC